MDNQSYAYGKNHWQIDLDLRVLLSRYWKNWDLYWEELAVFGGLAGSDAYFLNPVRKQDELVLVVHDPLGNRIERVRLSATQKNLLKRLAQMNTVPYERGSNWHRYFAMGYLLAEPALTQILSATNAVIYLLDKYAPEHAATKTRLLSSGAWGSVWTDDTREGSDWGPPSFTAREDGELWRLSGQREFSSGAGLSDYAVVSARLEGVLEARANALFLVSRRNRSGGLNYRVLGLNEAPVAPPTGDVEFEKTEAYLIGTPEEGAGYLQEISTLNLLYKAVSAIGIARKAQLEAFFRLQNRQTPGRSLLEAPLVRYDLVDLAVRIAGSLALSFRAVNAWNSSWQARPPYNSDYHYTRLLALLCRIRALDHAIAVAQTAIELLGGVGSIKGLEMIRLAQGALLSSLWETPLNTLGLDALEILYRKGGLEALKAEFESRLQTIQTIEAGVALEALRKTLAQLSGMRLEEAQEHKEALRTLADVATATLLYDLASVGGERYLKLAALYVQRFLQAQEYSSWAINDPLIWQAVRETSLT